MQLTVIGSGSKGNCYILHNEREALMLEAGVPFKDVLKAVGSEVTGRLRACLVTHEHGDHAKYVKEVLDHAIPVYATSGTIGALKGKPSKVMKPINFRLKTEYPDYVTPWLPVWIGGFTILPFHTNHDAVKPCGFFICHNETGNMLFATDTRFIPSTFKDLTNIMIECNYDERMLQERADIPDTLKDRIRASHMSVDTCIESLMSNDLSHVVTVMLIHISEGNGDPWRFTERVQQAVGPNIKVVAVKAGEIHAMTKFPF